MQEINFLTSGKLTMNSKQCRSRSSPYIMRVRGTDHVYDVLPHNALQYQLLARHGQRQFRHVKGQILTSIIQIHRLFIIFTKCNNLVKQTTTMHEIRLIYNVCKSNLESGTVTITHTGIHEDFFG